MKEFKILLKNIFHLYFWKYNESSPGIHFNTNLLCLFINGGLWYFKCYDSFFISLISIIITLSLDRSIYRCYYDYNNEDDQRVFLGTIIIGLFGVSLLFSALIILLSKYVGLIFSSIPFFPYYLLALSILYLSNLYKVTIIYYRLTEQSKKYVLFSLGYFLFNSFLIIASVVFLRQGAVGKLYANLITNLVFFFIAFYAI